MPLPSDPLTSWPPRKLDPVYHKMAEWTAWYSGDPSSLVGYYNSGDLSRPHNRPSQHRGGIVGWAARMFWGEPTNQGAKRAKLHVPLARDIATTSARLLFSEPPTLTVPDKRTQERLDQLVDDGAHATLLAAAETGSAKGGVYLRIVWDKSLLDRPWLSRVDATAAVGEFRWDRLVAVTFWREIWRENNKVLRHLERHEPGNILHGLYEGTPDKLGEQVGLSAAADTAWLTADQAVTFDGATAIIGTGVDRLTAVYVPNITPAPAWEHIPSAAALGRSDYDGVEGILDALDETWTSLMRDVRLAVARLVVPEEYLRSLGPGKGAAFDVDQEIFVPVQTMADDERGLNIELVQPDIRVDQHLRLADQQVRTIVESAGFAAQSFGMSDTTAATATEVVARERESFIGRDAKIMHWRPALKEILETLLMIDVQVFGTSVEPQTPEVDFGDTVSQDPESVARTLQLLEVARAISIWMKVKTLHPDWEDADIRVEVDRIKSDAGGSGDPELDLGRLAGNRPPAGDPGDGEDPGEGDA